MVKNSNINIALIGNPNSGKTSLFNHLTGLNQKVGNFAGVTVDKKTGKCKLNDGQYAEITDLPGLYSLYPRSADEQIVFDFLNDKESSDYPDLVLVVVDASNLKRNLFLFTQLHDLGVPIILVLTMTDVAQQQGLYIDTNRLSENLKIPVVEVNARTGKNLFRLKQQILTTQQVFGGYSIDLDTFVPETTNAIKSEFGIENTYQALQVAHQFENLRSFSKADKAKIKEIIADSDFNSRAIQVSETMHRYARVDELMTKVISGNNRITFSEKLDAVLTHKVWGYLLFFAILFVMFQAIFAWASVPMDLIDGGISATNDFLKEYLPAGPLTGLITDGIVAGLGGILIFIPQIAILFAFISILEETGYMARVMFIMDKFMRKFGMNGRSVVPLVSGLACAVPGIMSARSIDSPKERLITIFVTPFMSCSARLPVYAILISLVIPSSSFLGIFNVQGLVLMGLYLLGFLAAVITGYFMHFLLNVKGPKSFFMLELPSYKMPRWKNVGITIVEKIKSFVFEAGKVILAISIVLWVLSSFGPGNKIEQAENTIVKEAGIRYYSEEELTQMIASSQLENSYAGHFGKFIEPAIRPLGFDWKIGIAIITSFAAREVFVGTMATIYSLGGDAEADSLKERMSLEKDPATGKLFYTLPLGLSLLVFYAFAMQCMSTLAIVQRETKGWKWPLIQFIFMTIIAYLASYVTFAFFS